MKNDNGGCLFFGSLCRNYEGIYVIEYYDGVPEIRHGIFDQACL